MKRIARILVGVCISRLYKVSVFNSVIFVFPRPGRCGLKPHRIGLWNYRNILLIFIQPRRGGICAEKISHPKDSFLRL